MPYHKINYGSTPNSNNSNNNNSNSNNNNPTNPTSFKQVLNQQNQAPDILIDYEEKAKNKKISKTLFRDNVTEKLLTVLNTKNHPNALLIGDAGTGKTAIVEDLAMRLYEKDPLTIDMLKNTPLTEDAKIYELPLHALIEGSIYRGQMENKLKEVITFATDQRNHVILYIDEMHQLDTNQELKTVSEILKPALSRDELHVIGSTTTQELKHLKNNPALTRRFNNIIVEELTNEQTYTILENILPKLNTNNVIVKPDTLNYIIKTANKYAKSLNTSRPDSAITILDQSLATAKLQNVIITHQTGSSINPKVTEQVVQKASAQLINSNNVLTQNTIKTLKDTFDKYIIGQDNAKTKLIDIIKSKVLDLTPSNKPKSILFSGPTGTGKTEIGKQLAKVLFGSKDDFIYLNMTEYANRDSLNRLIGSPKGYVGSTSSQPLPLDKLKSNPFKIVLLDEFEKASDTVKRVFMQALDEGYIKYNDDSLVDFSQAIVIATTNAGSEQATVQSVGFNTNETTSNTQLTKSLSNSFSPELLNRFEHVVGFESITKDDYSKILCIKYNSLLNSMKENRSPYNIEPKVATSDMDFIQKLVESSYDPIKNGRPAERTIRQFIEEEIYKDVYKYNIQLT